MGKFTSNAIPKPYSYGISNTFGWYVFNLSRMCTEMTVRYKSRFLRICTTFRTFLPKIHWITIYNVCIYAQIHYTYFKIYIRKLVSKSLELKIEHEFWGTVPYPRRRLTFTICDYIYLRVKRLISNFFFFFFPILGWLHTSKKIDCLSNNIRTNTNTLQL